MPTPSDHEKRYYSIGEVAERIGVPASKIRYWDGEFPHLKPLKNNRGERRFTAKHLTQLRQINDLVHGRGFTVEGARRELAAMRDWPADKAEAIARLTAVRDRLRELLGE